MIPGWTGRAWMDNSMYFTVYTLPLLPKVCARASITSAGRVNLDMIAPYLVNKLH